MKLRNRSLLALVLALALFAVSCGSSAEDAVDTATDAVEDAAEDVEEMAEDAVEDTADAVEDAVSDVAMPGEGKTAKMGRANWSSGYVHAQILHDLMAELGYDVSSPDSLEFAPDLGYQTMAVGDMDFWANSWYPGHLSWFAGDLPDGTTVGENLERIEGSLLPDAGLQGFLVTKAWADEAGFGSFEEINADEALWGALDTDGNGKGEIFGCPEDWTCDDITASMIAFAGWENLEQKQAGYDALFAEFSQKAKNGEPAIMYTWTPAPYTAQVIPGIDVMWLSMSNENVLDDSNPLDKEGGADYTQGEGFGDLGEDTCLSGADGCQLGWEAADIEITANKAWLADNPAAHELFNQFKPSVFDVSLALVELDASDGSQADVERIAAQWITDNRDQVDEWLDAARAAG